MNLLFYKIKNTNQLQRFMLFLITLILFFVMIHTFLLNDIGIIDKILINLFNFVFYCFLFFVVINYKIILNCVAELAKRMKKIKWRISVYGVINTIVFFILLYKTELALLDNTMLFILTLIIFISTNWFVTNKENIINDTLINRKHIAAIIFLSLCFSFSLVGSKCLIYPINMHISIFNVIDFLGISITGFPLIVFIITYMNRFCINGNQINENLPWKIYILCFIIIIGVSIYYMWAFNPTISSPDTLYCMNYATNSIRGMENWHPPFYVLWLKVIIRICNSTYAVLLVQYVWFSLVFLEGMRLLYRRGISSIVIVLLTVFTVLSCSNMIQLTTIWKDIPYSISLMWLTIIIAKLLFEKSDKKVFVYIELICALICVNFMRQNGIVVFILTIVLLFFVYNKNRRILISLASSIIISLLIQFPLYSYLDINSNTGGGKYIGLGQDIMGVYYNGGNLSTETMNIVNTLSFNDVQNFRYSPYYAESSYDLDVPMLEFVGSYLETFIKNPVLMTRTMICRIDAGWNILMGQNGELGCVNLLETMDYDDTWKTLAPQRQNNYFTEFISKISAITVDNSMLYALEWRSGIWTLLTMCAFITCWIFKKNKRVLIVFVVFCGQFISLILTTGWADFRYYWPLNLMSLLLIMFCLVTKKCEE